MNWTNLYHSPSRSIGMALLAVAALGLSACEKTKTKVVIIPDDPSVRTVAIFAYCPFALPPGIEAGNEVECGEVTTELDPADASKGIVDVSFFRIKATGTASRPPLFVHYGGPGTTGFDALTDLVDQRDRLAQKRDIVAVAQRGTHFSVAIPACSRSLKATATPEDITAWSAACKSDLEAAGIDYQRFSTTAAVRDVEAIRQALHYDKISWFGISYGTTFALEHMRQFGHTVDRAILDSVYPPNASARYFADQYLDIVQAWKEYGGLLGLAADANEQFNALFATLQEKGSISVGGYRRPVTAETVLNLSRGLGMQQGGFWAFASLVNGYNQLTGEMSISGIDSGMADAIAEFCSNAGLTEAELGLCYDAITGEAQAAASARGGTSMTEELTQLLVCVEDAFANDLDGVKADIAARQLTAPVANAIIQMLESYAAFCAPYKTEWQAAATYRQPVSVPVSTLVINSKFDSATPLAYARLAQASLPNSVLRVSQGTAHGVLRFAWPEESKEDARKNDCIAGVINEALDGNMQRIRSNACLNFVAP